MNYAAILTENNWREGVDPISELVAVIDDDGLIWGAGDDLAEALAEALELKLKLATR